jgi:hypothetical protein
MIRIADRASDVSLLLQVKALESLATDAIPSNADADLLRKFSTLRTTTDAKPPPARPLRAPVFVSGIVRRMARFVVHLTGRQGAEGDRPHYGKIKAAMCGRSVWVASFCLHIVLGQAATAPCEVRGTASTRKAIRHQGSPRHCAHLALSVRLIERLRAMIAWSESPPETAGPSRLASRATGTRRLAALTGPQEGDRSPA